MNSSDVGFVDAVRVSVQRQVRAALERKGITDERSLLDCPRCGERIIALDVPVSFARAGDEQICRPCRAQAELEATEQQGIDVGGEG